MVTERELTLLQEQITAARALAAASPQYEASDGIESKPLRVTTPDYSMADEQEHVERLRTLLASYYAELQEAARTLPSEEELAARAAAQLEAEQLARIPFSADKVQLSGAEGSTALSQITRRLTDPDIPESRRDIAPICGIRTELFGALIASEQRSLRPVGKTITSPGFACSPATPRCASRTNAGRYRCPRTTMPATSSLPCTYRRTARPSCTCLRWMTCWPRIIPTSRPGCRRISILNPAPDETGQYPMAAVNGRRSGLDRWRRPLSLDFGDVYYSGDDGLAESRFFPAGQWIAAALGE